MCLRFVFTLVLEAFTHLLPLPPSQREGPVAFSDKEVEQ